MLLIDDPETVVLANAACNRLGLDVISTGVVAAFAVEAFEKGYLAGRDLGGLEPAWGSREYLLGVIDLIARREGAGDLLADGVQAAAEKLGPGAMEFAVHAHGLEVPMQDPRAFVSLALSYAVSPRGASHTETMSFYVEQGFEFADMGYPDGLKLHVAEGKGKMTRIMHDVATAYENGGLCKFMLVAGIGPTDIAEWVSAAAGWNFSREDVLKVGARTVAAKHFFNFDRLGLKPEADLARRMRLEPRGTGGSARSLPDMETLVRDYYAARGWSEDGRPPDQERPR